MLVELTPGELYCLNLPGYGEKEVRRNFMVWSIDHKHWATRPVKSVANGDPLLFLGSDFSFSMCRENFLFLFDESVILIEGFNHGYLKLCR